MPLSKSRGLLLCLGALLLQASVSAQTERAARKRNAWVAGARKRCLRGLVTIEPPWGFEEKVLAWASALGFATWLDEALPLDQRRQVALTAAHWTSLNDVFDGVEAQPLRQTLAHRFLKFPRGVTACSRFFPFPDLLAFSKNSANDTESIFMNPHLLENNSVNFLPLPKGRWFEPAIAFAAPRFVSSLRLQKKFLRPATQRLRAMQALTEKAAGQRMLRMSQVVVVGMHARHSDAREWKWNHPYIDPPSEDYYRGALRWIISAIRGRTTPVFRINSWPQEYSELQDTFDSLAPRSADPPPHSSLRKRSLPLIAVAVVSNDMFWVNDSLLPALHQDLRRAKVIGVELFAAGSEDAMADLALLSLCNSSVISYGTFGATGALLAGGRTVFYDMKDPSSFTYAIAKFLPLWFIAH